MLTDEQHQTLNNILEILNKSAYEILPDATIKKKGKSKKVLSAMDFYKDNLEVLIDYTMATFTDAITFLASRIVDKPKSETNKFSNDKMAQTLESCEFYYEKFRWFVTKEKIKVFYYKTSAVAEEYLFLTTHDNDPKFFNCFELHPDELEKFMGIVELFNRDIESASEKLSWKKLVSIIIDDLQTTSKYRLETEPQVFTNDPTVPAFKYFDLEGLVEWGQNYEKIHGERPPTPAWDCFFARVRELGMVPVMKAFIAGLFVDYNKTKQVLYIYGNGNDGKSQVLSAIYRYMGENVTYNLPQDMQANQFTVSAAYAKRVFLCDELKNSKVLKTGVLHSITGGGIHRIENKFEKVFSAEIYGIGILASNFEPELEDVTNQRARLLYVEIDSAKNEDIFEAGLDFSESIKSDAEIQGVIYEGLKYFQELNPSGAFFKMPAEHHEVLDNLLDERSEHINRFIDVCFEFDPEFSMRDRLTKLFYDHSLENFFDDEAKIPRSYLDKKVSKVIFEKLLTVNKGIGKKSKRIDGVKTRIIYGVKIKDEFKYLRESSKV